MRFFKNNYLVYLLVLSAVFAFSSLASRSVTLATRAVSAQSQEPVIVIDPGHGGEDGGAVSCTGVRESELNLKISLRLNDLLTLLGRRTKMIRTQDTALYQTDAGSVAEKKRSDLKERVRIIGQTPGALLLSIHQNTFPEERYRGAQVFYAPTGESGLLAESIQSAICTYVTPENHRKIKPSDGIYLMDHIQCTGVLVECGFLSNREEEQLLRSDDYQKKLVCAIAGGTTTFLNEKTEV